MPTKPATTEACCQPVGENCCPPQPALPDRPLLTAEQAGDLAGMFKILANDTRLRLLHALVRNKEMCVSELAETVGMKPQAVSNQLQRLVDLGHLASRRQGNNVYYRIVDPCITNMLHQGLCLTEAAQAHRDGSRR